MTTKGKTNGQLPPVPPSRYSSLGPADDSPRDPTEGADLQAIGGAVLGVVRSGDAILFGLTRDGGALRIQLFEGEARTSLYASNAGDLKDKLNDIIRMTT